MRRAMTLLLCLILLPTIPWISTPASGGTVVLGHFKDTTVTASFVFDAPGANSSAQLELPKAATIVEASVDITGRPYLQNISISADTKEDFAACNLSNMDINSSEGELQLPRDNSRNDEFNGSALDARWNWFNTPYAHDLGVNRSGYLHIVSPRMTNFGTADSGILVYQTVSGGFYVETKIVSSPQNNYEKSGIMVRQDSSNWVALKYQSENGAKVQMTRKVGGFTTDTMVAVSASPVYLGMERDGNSFSCRYSTDGSAWTALSGGPWNVALTDAVWAGLIVADGSSNNNYAADFDYFRLSKYMGNGSMLSGWTEAPGIVTQAKATCTGVLNPLNTSFQLSLRTGPENPLQTLMPGVTTQLSPPGSNISYKIEMSSNGVRTPDLYGLRINLSIPHYPSEVSLGLGPGAPFWTLPGELNSTRTVDMKDAIAAFLEMAAPGPGGNVTIPLNISSSTPGMLTILNLTIEYLIGVPPAAPSLRSPASGNYLSSTPPVLSLDATDADGDPLLFSVELSENGFQTKTSYNQTLSGAGWSKGNRSYLPGEEASLRPSMSFVDGRAYSWRARAFDGAYWSPYSDVRNFTVDTSPPLGFPQDEGNFTSIPDSLTATLHFHDNESGVNSHEYRVGTSPGAWDVVPNTTTANTSVKVSGLSLSMGSTYYFTARARNLAGLWSACASTDGIMYWPAGMEPSNIRIDQPAAASNLSGIAVVSGTSWLRDGWTRNHTVQVRIDTGPWKNATFVGAPPTYARNWTMKWDTTQIPDGNHTVWARIALGFADATEITITNVPVTVTNTVPEPPVPVILADFFPADNVTLSIPENSSLEFSIRTDAQSPTIAWMVDGVKRPVEVYPKFVFLAGYTAAGAHDISVLIRSGNLSLQHNWTINVININRPPVVSILAPVANSLWKAEESITFNASPSQDPDLEDHLRFSWVLGDGFVLNGSQVIHIYTEAGRYQVILTVSDGQLESRAYLNLTISPPEKTVQAGGGPSSQFLPLVIVMIVAAAASGGGFMYWSRRRAAAAERARAKAAEEELAATRPKDAASGHEGISPSRTSETSADEVMRVSAKTHADASLSSTPSYSAKVAESSAASESSARATESSARVTESATASGYSATPSYSEPVPELPSFDEFPEAEAVPTMEVMEVAPEPVAPPKPVRPAPKATAPVGRPATPPTPTRPATPVTPTRPATPATPSRPATPAAPFRPATPTPSARPATPAAPFRPATPTPPARPATPATPSRPATPAVPARPTTPAVPAQPSKKPETLEEIMAALKDH